MIIKYSTVNLPELALHTLFESIALLSKRKPPDPSTLSMSKEEMLSLFDSFTKSDLQVLLQSEPLSLLEREY